jgi:hypothetical protein
MTDFIPSVWKNAARDILRGASLDRFGPQRRGHREPLTMEQIQEFEAWDDAFSQIRELGLERGWLSREGEVQTPLGTWVYDEPEAEYDARLKQWQEENCPDGTVTFRVLRETGDG